MAMTGSTQAKAVGQSTRDSIAASLDQLEFLIDTAPTSGFDIDYVESLEESLRRLHARFRTHRARSFGTEELGAIPPELVELQGRLREEHPALLGHLDRLIRSAPSMGDRPQDDNDVFVLRVRELIAIMRRHLAEEDRLLYVALSHDTGGES